MYIPFPYSKGLHNKHGLCTFKHKFVHTPCTFKQEFVHTLCTFKHFQLFKVMVVADRGESGMGWAAIDDFEFLYDVFEVTILTN